MTGAAEIPVPAAAPRVLVLGQAPHVLEAVMHELGLLGLEVSGSTRPERAATDFDARDFDLIAFGGGVDRAVRAAAKAAFARRNPHVRLLDTFAPVAVHQIRQALDGVRAPVDLARYFGRVGYDGPGKADFETLRTLQALHPDAIVFEAIDVLLDRGIDLAPEAVDAKLIAGRRGGYCFEQNGLFARALAAMGFEVQGLLARARWMMPAGAPPQAATHMVVKVTIDGLPWLADVGFGSSMPAAPLRMDLTQPQPTPHDVYRVVPYGAALLVQVRRDGTWLPVYEVSPEPRFEADYQVASWFTATHPSSHFRHNLIAARTTPEARHALLDNRLTVRRPDGAAERQVLDADGIERVLVETFGLPVEPDWRQVIERAAVLQPETQVASPPNSASITPAAG
jgi:N-hydroxyarylamine O-acetyltransferase